jgi:high affinity sulfate transporter 1
MLLRFMPGLASLLRYRREWLPGDIAAGLAVATVALPVGIAYAEIVQVPAVIGMYSAIFPLFAYALFGSSRQLIVGPDAATCIMIAAGLSALAEGDPARYLALLPAFTLITGLLYLLAGLGRLGFIASFLSHPILIGYLNGIAIVILLGQMPKLLGYPSDARELVPRMLELVERVPASNPATAILGLVCLALLPPLKRWAPRLPGPLLVVAAGIAAVALLDLPHHGVAVSGPIPAGLPEPKLALFDLATYRALLSDAAGIVLISFISGILTAKSFASLNRYPIDANQELVAYGISNIASGLVQGFAVTGANSRTAVSNATGGRSHLVGIVAGSAMLLVLLFLTGPLAMVPTAALAAIIVVAACGLFDVDGLVRLFRMSWREALLSLATTLGVLILGVLPGVVLAVALSLLWLLAQAARPRDAVLGRVAGLKGFHSVADHPEARTEPGLLLFRYSGNLLFFNIEHFCDRLRARIAEAPQPVRWVVVDASPVNLFDATAVQRLEALRTELAAAGVRLAYARMKRIAGRNFAPSWLSQHGQAVAPDRFPTLRSAVRAYRATDSSAART